MAGAHSRNLSERQRLLLEVFAVIAQDALHSGSGDAGRRYLATVRGFDLPLQALPFGWYTTPREVEAQLVSMGFTKREAAIVVDPSDVAWNGRLICPVRDPRGAARTFFSRDITEGAPHGSRYSFLRLGTKPIAFGLDMALQDKAGGKENLILVEGMIDVVALNARGVLNVAAIGGHGKYLTPRRWAALRALEVQQVTLLLDNDQYGKEGTVAALGAASITVAAPHVMIVDPAKLAPYKDPDELVRFEGANAFLSLISRERVHGRHYTRLACGAFADK